jgi:GAF domain-containing protein
MMKWVQEADAAGVSSEVSEMARENLLGQTFVELADTLVDTYDVLDFLHLLTDRCVDLLGVTEAGVMLADPAGGLRVMASSSERMRALELLEVQNHDGPCLDAWTIKAAVSEGDLIEGAASRWPQFTPIAIDAGFRSVYALPMRLREETIGALNLFHQEPNGVSGADLRLAQALADVATIGILQHRAAEEARLLAEQLQYALNSRVTIEQAKGVLSERSNIDAETAFAALRRYARNNNARLVDVAKGVVDRTLAAEAVSPMRRTPWPETPPPGPPRAS